MAMFSWLEAYKQNVKKLYPEQTPDKAMKAVSPISEPSFKMGENGANGNGAGASAGGMFGAEGIRYTGSGPDGKVQPDQPTAINNYAEHEGEMVVDASKVEAMGGPDQAQSIIDQIAMKNLEGKTKLKGYQTGGIVTDPKKTTTTAPTTGLTATQAGIQGAGDPGREFKKGMKVFGEGGKVYEAGEGGLFNLSADPSTATEAGVFGYGAEQLQVGGKVTGTGGQVFGKTGEDQFTALEGEKIEPGKGALTPEESVAAMKAGTLEAAKPPTPGEAVTPEAGTATAISRLTGLSYGESQVATTMTNNLTQMIGSAKSADIMAIMGDPSISGGAKRAAIGMVRRSHGATMSKVLGDIAEGRYKTQDKAIADLARVSQNAQNFQENVRQFDQNYAMQADKFQWTQNKFNAQSQFEAGDFEGYADTMKNMGITIDTSLLKDEQSRQIVRNASDDLLEDITINGKDYGDAGVQESLGDMWDAQNPDKAGQMDPAWALNEYDRIKSRNSPGFSVFSDYSDQQLATFPGVRPDDAPEGWTLADSDFEYKGLKGREGVVQVMSELENGGGMTFGTDADGNQTVEYDYTNPIWKAFGMWERDPAAVNDVWSADEIDFVTPQAADVALGAIVKAKDGSIWEKTSGTEFKKVAETMNDYRQGRDGEDPVVVSKFSFSIEEIEGASLYTDTLQDKKTNTTFMKVDPKFDIETDDKGNEIPGDGMIDVNDYAKDPAKYGGFENDPRFQNKKEGDQERIGDILWRKKADGTWTSTPVPTPEDIEIDPWAQESTDLLYNFDPFPTEDVTGGMTLDYLGFKSEINADANMQRRILGSTKGDTITDSGGQVWTYQGDTSAGMPGSWQVTAKKVEGEAPSEEWTKIVDERAFSLATDTTLPNRWADIKKIQKSSNFADMQIAPKVIAQLPAFDPLKTNTEGGRTGFVDAAPLEGSIITVIGFPVVVKSEVRFEKSSGLEYFLAETQSGRTIHIFAEGQYKPGNLR